LFTRRTADGYHLLPPFSITVDVFIADVIVIGIITEKILTQKVSDFFVLIVKRLMGHHHSVKLALTYRI
jgi:hypothetical protein